MNLEKAQHIVDELNSSVCAKTEQTPFELTLKSIHDYSVKCFDTEVWNSSTNDCYAENGTLLDFRNYLMYRLQVISLEKFHNYKQLVDYFSKQVTILFEDVPIN
jgi:hypothetical protein